MRAVASIDGAVLLSGGDMRGKREAKQRISWRESVWSVWRGLERVVYIGNGSGGSGCSALLFGCW